MYYYLPTTRTIRKKQMELGTSARSGQEIRAKTLKQKESERRAREVLGGEYENN
jgi:hypothetical protein